MLLPLFAPLNHNGKYVQTKMLELDENTVKNTEIGAKDGQKQTRYCSQFHWIA